MATENSELVWFTVDETSMKGEPVKALAALRKAQKAASEAKAAFETSFIKATRESGIIKDDEGLAFGYRFGKLAVAKTTGKAAVKTTGKPKFSF